MDHRDGGMLPHIPLTPLKFLIKMLKWEKNKELENEVLDEFAGYTYPSDHAVVVETV